MSGDLERVITPRILVDRVMGVLQKVRARLEQQPVAVYRVSVLVEVARAGAVIRAAGLAFFSERCEQRLVEGIGTRQNAGFLREPRDSKAGQHEAGEQ